jgi:hypothetical protein
LPLPETVYAASPADFQRFRQSSWQWDALHTGRLTTSRAAACLGFYETSSAKKLNIPKSLSGHSKAVHAWNFLREEAPRDFNFINEDFKRSSSSSSSSNESTNNCGNNNSSSSVPTSKGSNSNTSSRHSTKVWHQRDTNDRGGQTFPAPFAYRPQGPSVQHSRGYSSAASARMAWGSAQEATAVLTALNVFHHLQGGSKGPSSVCEIGMCALEALPYPMMPLRPHYSLQVQSWLDEGSLPAIGASPDGLITHADGTTEVLEVKCHSPFVDASYDRRSAHGRVGSCALHLRDRGPASTLATWHLPQSFLHILCAGPSCTGAVLVSLSATKGATLYRVKRDDEFIFQMLSWIRLFHVTFVLGRTISPDGALGAEAASQPRPPEEGFFEGLPGYQPFLDSVLAMAERATVLTHVSNGDVQRSPKNGQFFLD